MLQNSKFDKFHIKSSQHCDLNESSSHDYQESYESISLDDSRIINSQHNMLWSRGDEIIPGSSQNSAHANFGQQEAPSMNKKRSSLVTQPSMYESHAHMHVN